MNKKKILKTILESGIDGNSSNTFYPITKVLETLPKESKKISFTLKELEEVSIQISKKWEKEIDKVINYKEI